MELTLQDIPFDIIAYELLLYLPARDIVHLTMTCRKFHDTLDVDHVWEFLYRTLGYRVDFLAKKHDPSLAYWKQHGFQFDDSDRVSWKQRHLYWEEVGKCEKQDKNHMECYRCGRNVCLKHSGMDALTQYEKIITHWNPRITKKIGPICISCTLQRRMLAIEMSKINHRTIPNSDDKTRVTMKFHVFMRMRQSMGFRCSSSSVKMLLFD